MSLFPAYGSRNENGDKSPTKTSDSLSWVQNKSCPPEVGKIPSPPPLARSHSESQSSSSEKGRSRSRSNSVCEEPSKIPVEKEVCPLEKEQRSPSLSREQRSCSQSRKQNSKSRSRSRSSSVSRKQMTRSRSRSRKLRSRSRSRSRKLRSRSKSKPRKYNSSSDSRTRKKRSGSRSRSKKQRSRSRSRSRRYKSKYGYRSKKRDSRSRSRSRKRKSRSRSRSRKWRSRSRSRSRKLKSRSRSRSRKRKSRSISRSRKWRSGSRSRKRKSRSRSRRRKSRSRSRKRKSRSRSRKRKSRSRSRSRKRKSISRSRSKRQKSRSRSRSRRRKSRSRSRSRKRKSRSSSRSRKQKSRSRSLSRKPKSRSRSRSGDHLRSRTDILVSKSKSVFLTDLIGLVNPEDAFYIEKSGDKNNLIFPMTHFSQLARYNLKTKGTLGSVFTKSSNVGLRKVLRYFKRRGRKVLYGNAELVRAVIHKTHAGATSDNNTQCYIPLHLTYTELNEVRTKITTGNQSEQNTEDILPEFDSDDEEKTENSDDAECAFWQKKAKEYNERLGREPSNIDLWLEFVRFQDKSFRYLFKDEENGKKKKASLKAVAERKISIIDSAIKKNIRSLDLHFERLKVGEDIWDDKKIKQEWGTVIINFPNKLEVWHRYLAFVQTSFTSFSITSVINTFAKCTEKLQQIKNGVFITHAPPKDLGKCLIDVTVQVAFVWKQAGYMERSVALFQALIELNLFAPPHAKSKNITFDAKIAMFEAFWDSRAPRFGEENAIGWAQVMAKRQQMEFPEVVLGGTQDEEDEIVAKGGETSDLWLALESRRERCHWLPWEQDPEDCEDPERMVSFEDISSHLYILDTNEEYFYLVVQFLKFLGVPYAHNLISQRVDIRNRNNEDVSSDIFRPLILENLKDDKLFGRSEKIKEFLCDDTGILNFPEIGPSSFDSSCDDYYKFICRVLQQASGVIQLPCKIDLLILYIKVLGWKYATLKLDPKVDLKRFSKELKKKVKQLLKSEEFRTCLPVYREYGKLEEVMGHEEDSENVFTTALTIGTATGNILDTLNPNFKSIMELFTSYLELEMKREGQTGKGHYSNNIVHSLSSILLEGKFSANSGSPVPGPVILKTKKQLQEMQGSSLLSAYEDVTAKEKESKTLLAAKLTSFLALIQLFTVGFKSSFTTYESAIKNIESGFDNPVPPKLEDISLPGESLKKPKSPKTTASNKSYLLECIIKEYLWFTELSSHLHLVTGGERISPLQLRSVLSLAVKVAPENPEFLLHFSFNQTWRDLLSCPDIVSQNPSILMSLCRLLPHIQRTVTLVKKADEGLLSSGHRLERALEQGVSCLPGRHCPLLWRIYLALIASTRPAGIKQLAYRALSSCPGVKSVYLDCVRWVPEMLKEIVKLLGEKGIRVRLPLEELQVLTEVELDLEDEMDSPKEVGSDSADEMEAHEEIGSDLKDDTGSSKKFKSTSAEEVSNATKEVGAAPDVMDVPKEAVSVLENEVVIPKEDEPDLDVNLDI